jgi:hypothetical protein
MIRLSTPTLAATVNESRGAEIHEITAHGRHPLLWSDDASWPLPSSRSTTLGSTVMDWLSHYRGGWQGLFPNAGADSEALGVPLPFHGETSTAAWTVVRSDVRSVTLETPSRLPLVLQRTVELSDDRPRLTVRERVENTSGFTVPFLWGHHPAWLAAPGTRVDVPPCRVVVDPGFDTELNDLPPGLSAEWPHVTGKSGNLIDLATMGEGNVERLARLHDLSAGWFALRWEFASIGACLSWDIRTFPWLWYWVEVGGPGFPWFGRSRILALEPVNTSQGGGLQAALALGEGLQLEAGEVRETALHLTVFEADGRPVTGVSDDGSPLFG